MVPKSFAQHQPPQGKAVPGQSFHPEPDQHPSPSLENPLCPVSPPQDSLCHVFACAPCLSWGQKTTLLLLRGDPDFPSNNQALLLTGRPSHL